MSKEVLFPHIYHQGAKPPNIDKWDVEMFQQFLYLAQNEGTTRIKVVAGNKSGEYVVNVVPYGPRITTPQRT
jgi:hypothetical protein